jgi:hypothetical protein
VQSERLEQRALHKRQEPSHLRGVQQKFPIIFSPFVRSRGDGTRAGDRACVWVWFCRGEGDVRIPGALGNERNLSLGITRSHAPAAEYALDLLRRRDLANVEENLLAQQVSAEELCVGGEGEAAQASGRM